MPNAGYNALRVVLRSLEPLISPIIAILIGCLLALAGIAFLVCACTVGIESRDCRLARKILRGEQGVSAPQRERIIRDLQNSDDPAHRGLAQRLSAQGRHEHPGHAST